MSINEAIAPELIGQIMVSIVSNFSPLQEYYNNINRELTERLDSLGDDTSITESTDTAADRPDMSHVTLPSDLTAFATALDNFVTQEAYSSDVAPFILAAQSYIDTESVLTAAFARQVSQTEGYSEFQEFINMDPDQDFQVTYEDFKNIMNYLSGGETTADEEQDQEMFAGLDKDGNGVVTLVDYFA